jgi:hypothetical protein
VRSRKTARIVAAVALVALPALVPPAPVRAGDDIPPKAVLATLPFLDAPEPNRILIDLAPEGSTRPLRLFLDTGAPTSVMTPRVARSLGVMIRRVQQRPYRRATLLGRDLQFWVDTASSDTASRTGWEYGVLGGSFLTRYGVELDFAARRVRFLDPRRWQAPETPAGPDETVVPIRVTENRAILELAIGSGHVPVLLDTGLPWSLLLARSVAGRLGVTGQPLAGLSGQGVYGPLELTFAEVPWLGIGSLSLHDVPATVSAHGFFNVAGASDCALGIDVLSQFLVRIDYAHRRLWLRRRKDASMTFFGADYARGRRSGALVFPDPEGLRVAFVLPGSAAERLSLRPGDRAARVVTEPETAFVERFLAAVAAGGPVRVLRGDGGTAEDITLPGTRGPS